VATAVAADVVARPVAAGGVTAVAGGAVVDADAVGLAAADGIEDVAEAVGVPAGFALASVSGSFEDAGLSGAAIGPRGRVPSDPVPPRNA
jgi:hypothetical protein